MLRHSLRGARLEALEHLASCNEGDRAHRVRGYIQCLDFLLSDEFAKFAERDVTDPAEEEQVLPEDPMGFDSEGALEGSWETE